MTSILTLIKKEFRLYFNSPVAYIFITFFLVISSWMYMRSLFLVGQADMRNYFLLAPWLLLFLVPAISMKLLSEEKKIGTMEVLMTWPVRDYEVVLGKFFGSFLFLIIAILGTLPLLIILSYLGSPDWGAIIGSYLGTLFLAASFLAIGLWASGLTDNQIIAFIVSIVVIFVLFMLGNDSILFFVPQSIANFLKSLSLGSHYDSISRGVIDTRDVLYYLSIIGFFLYLNVKTMERRKN